VVVEPVGRWLFSWAGAVSGLNNPLPKPSVVIEGEYELK
jgi:hypothetical protein